jgi:hypothetical protein
MSVERAKAAFAAVASVECHRANTVQPRAALEVFPRIDANDICVNCLLWRDIASILDRRNVERIESLDLISDLAKIENRPWTEMLADDRTASVIAALLRPLHIRPTVIKFQGRSRRGYYREWFRALPCSGCQVLAKPALLP